MSYLNTKPNLLLLLLALEVLMASSFDLYPWGKYDFKETSDDLLDMLRESEHLKVWESTLASTLPNTNDKLLLKNSEGNTFQLNRKPTITPGALALTHATDEETLSATLKKNCAMLVDGFWSYEWCHGAEVRQYHMEQRGNAIHRDPDWSLGKQTRLVTLREQHEGDSPEEAGRRPITKMIEYFEGGQKCEENRSHRSTEVEIICCEGTHIKNFIAASVYYGFNENPSGPNNPHGLKLPAATLATIDEPKLCKYKATVCSPLMCKRPEELTTLTSTVPLKDSSVPQLAPVMKFINTTCLNKQEDWWTYELCFNSGVRQVRYEIEQSMTADGKLTQTQSVASQYQLGVAPLALYTNETGLKNMVVGTPGSVAMSETEASIIRSAGMVTPTFRTRGRDPHFLSLEFVGGTPCDLDTVNRTTVVDMYCGAKNRLVSIWEDSTCHYHVKVELAILCSFADFVPYKENTTVVEFLPYEFSGADENDLDTPAIHHNDQGEAVEQHSAPEVEVGIRVEPQEQADDRSASADDHAHHSEFITVAADISQEIIAAIASDNEDQAEVSIVENVSLEWNGQDWVFVEHDSTMDVSGDASTQQHATYTETQAAAPTTAAQVIEEVVTTAVTGDTVQEPDEPQVQPEPEEAEYDAQDTFLMDVRELYPDFDVVEMFVHLQASTHPKQLTKRFLVEHIESAIREQERTGRAWREAYQTRRWQEEESERVLREHRRRQQAEGSTEQRADVSYDVESDHIQEEFVDEDQ